MGFFDRLKSGLSRSREAINEIFYMGGEVDEDFWEDLEDTLVMGDMGGELAMRVADDLREQAARENLTRADPAVHASARPCPGVQNGRSRPLRGRALVRLSGHRFGAIQTNTVG